MIDSVTSKTSWSFNDLEVLLELTNASRVNRIREYSWEIFDGVCAYASCKELNSDVLKDVELQTMMKLVYVISESIRSRELQLMVAEKLCTSLSPQCFSVLLYALRLMILKNKSKEYTQSGAYSVVAILIMLEPYQYI